MIAGTFGGYKAETARDHETGPAQRREGPVGWDAPGLVAVT
jgi:hypothetical protein